MTEFVLYFTAIILSFSISDASGLPTNYEYYTSDGIKSGLIANSNDFTLNGKVIRILSGSLHYFRVPKQYWRDRLLKMRGAGLNSVQLYSPWNLHEEIPGKYDFETGMLDLREFLKTIKEMDMFAMYRPGPYICGEWEFGGLPAWLLRDPKMKLRTSYEPYLNAVEKYFSKLMPIINEFQFSKNGPIIALQLENEFANYANVTKSKPDYDYLLLLKNTVINSGFKELLFTSDGSEKAADRSGALPGILSTANFNDNVIQRLTSLKKSQNKTLYVAEYWSGWFTHWGDKHMSNMNPVKAYGDKYEQILLGMNASVNVYMFLGGTNFGFMNGANDVKSNGFPEIDITSYDYSACLSEAGDYTDKYWKTKEIIEKLHKLRPELPKVKIYETPKISEKGNYGVINVTKYLTFENILKHIKPEHSDRPKHMEELNIGPNYGQNFGFILYRTNISNGTDIIVKGNMSDRAVIFIDGQQTEVIEVVNKESKLSETAKKLKPNDNKLDILVENLGRINFGKHIDYQRKGLNGDVLVDGNIVKNYQIFPLEFKLNFFNLIQNDNWISIENSTKSPALFKAFLDIKGQPFDTFLTLKNWVKSVVFVNGFNCGRLWNIGPQKSLYIPGIFLKTGMNEIIIFELHSNGNSIEFSEKQYL